MNDTTKTKDREIPAKTHKTERSEPNKANLLNLKPLPNGRPMGDNVTEDVKTLMGYLD